MIENEQSMTAVPFGHIRKGRQCHIRIAGKQIPAEVLDVRDRVIRLRCPANGIPTDGTGLVLEFKDRNSVAGYYARVLTVSPETLSELVLLRSASLNREELRTTLRVPTDIPVTVKSVQSGECVEGKLLNISAGGAYIEIAGPFEVTGTPRLELCMKEEPSLRIQGKVVHIEGEGDSTACRIGVQFSEVSAEDARTITWYVWSRVQAFFPETD